MVGREPEASRGHILEHPVVPPLGESLPENSANSEPGNRAKFLILPFELLDPAVLGLLGHMSHSIPFSPPPPPLTHVGLSFCSGLNKPQARHVVVRAHTMEVGRQAAGRIWGSPPRTQSLAEAPSAHWRADSPPFQTTQLHNGTDFSFTLSCIKPYDGSQRNEAAVQEWDSLSVQYIHIQ